MSTPQTPSSDALLAAARASRDCPTDWEIAFHEAGHVVVEVVIARSFPDSACISDDGATDHAGRTATRSFAMAKPPGMVEVGDDERLADLLDRQRQNYAAVLLGGQLATYLALGLSVDAYDIAGGVLYSDEDDMSTDMAKANALVDGMTPGGAEQFIEDAVVAAVGALRSQWAAVAAVAAELVGRRTLDRDDLYRLLQPGIPAL